MLLVLQKGPRTLEAAVISPSLEEVAVPKSMKNIEASAFCNCERLSSITLQEESKALETVLAAHPRSGYLEERQKIGPSKKLLWELYQ